jgi:hypothetical protein
VTLLVVFGAGASYDSVATREPKLASELRRTLHADAAIPLMSDDEHQARPPLADQLLDARPRFMEILKRFPMLDEIAPHLQLRPTGHSLEAQLEEYAGQVEVYPRRLQQLTALRFYIEAIIEQCEARWIQQSNVQLNVSALLDLIELLRGTRRQSVFVTFNYDRLLEYALERRFNRTFRYAADYVKSDALPLIKLHGSLGWRRLLAGSPPDFLTTSGVDRPRLIADEIGKLGDPGPILTRREITERQAHSAHIPALAIPLLHKREFECPDSHVNRLREELPRVRSILTIGWRAGEAAFLEILKHCRPSVHVSVVCGSIADAQDTIASLRRVLPDAHYEPIGSGFTGAIQTRAMIPAIVNAWPLERDRDWLPGW